MPDTDEHFPPKLRFDRHELAGSLGDLGTLLPISLGLILICGLDPTAVLLCVGAYYVLAGLYFRIVIPVQPMKVVGAYAIASSLSPAEITTAGLLLGVILIVLSTTGAITAVSKLVPKAVVRGVQLSTGVLLLTAGVRFIAGESELQGFQGAAEPFLSVSSIGPIPIGIILGCFFVVLILVLLGNRAIPAGLAVIILGTIVGLLLGGYHSLRDFDVGFHLPEFLPFGLPDVELLLVALTALALPQLPMTLGNAVIAQSDLTREYFGEKAAKRSSFRALALSMGLANLVTAPLGGMPMCHGSGGLAAHYRFGARTAGANLMIGVLFVVVALLVGDKAVAIMQTLPFAVLGALLVFAGSQLALTILDVRERRDMFVAITILAVALATNLAVGFGVGLLLAFAFRTLKLNV